MLIIYAMRPSVKVSFSIRDLNALRSPGAKSLKNAFFRSVFKFSTAAWALQPHRRALGGAASR